MRYPRKEPKTTYQERWYRYSNNSWCGTSNHTFIYCEERWNKFSLFLINDHTLITKTPQLDLNMIGRHTWILLVDVSTQRKPTKRDRQIPGADKAGIAVWMSPESIFNSKTRQEFVASTHERNTLSLMQKEERHDEPIEKWRFTESVSRLSLSKAIS